jgi:hypothetical protein
MTLFISKGTEYQICELEFTQMVTLVFLVRQFYCQNANKISEGIIQYIYWIHVCDLFVDTCLKNEPYQFI